MVEDPEVCDNLRGYVQWGSPGTFNFIFASSRWLLYLESGFFIEYAAKAIQSLQADFDHGLLPQDLY